MAEEKFENLDLDSFHKELAQPNSLQPGDLIMMKEIFPCKVISSVNSKPGKTGGPKTRIYGQDVFTDVKYEVMIRQSELIPRPIITKTEVLCIDTQDDILFIMGPDGDIREDLNLPNEAHLADVKANIKRILEQGIKECLVTYQQWGTGNDARIQICEVREGQDQ